MKGSNRGGRTERVDAEENTSSKNILNFTNYAGKKGLFYTFISLLLLSVVIIMFFSSAEYTYFESKQPVVSRAESMNNFVEDFRRDGRRAVYISGFRALIAMEEHIVEEGTFFSSPRTAFKEAFMNGSIGGENYSVLENSTFKDYIGKVDYLADDVGIRLDASVTDVELVQKTPWLLEAEVATDVFLDDKRGVASYNYTETFSSEISVLGFRDPLYSVYTDGKVLSSGIKRTPITNFVNDTNNANDTTNLEVHLNNSFYKASSSAPSFLMRLSGNLSSDENGIESMVDLEELSAQGLQTYNDRSVIDYLYFDDNATYTLCSVSDTSLPSYFNIDQAHLEPYEISPDLDGLYNC